MAQFQYTAVSADGKKLSGVIGASSEDDARKQLNTFGISILGIKKTAETGEKTVTTEPATSAELEKFEFEAIDKNGKKVIGTIPASSRYKAFKRLVDEYKFDVVYVVKFGATPEEKAKAKQEDLSILKAEYEEQAKEEGTAVEGEEQVSAAFEKKRQALLKKVDYILEKVKEVLTAYHGDINPENEKVIQAYIDKLLRIKSSTNLDYIESTSEELLKKVQDQELFLHKEKMASQQAKVQLQSQQLLAELHARPTDKKDISDDIESLHKKFEESESRLVQGIGQFLERFIASPEEKEIKSQIRAVSKQVWTFRKIWFTAPKAAKAEAYQSLQKVIDERNRLKEELKAAKLKRKSAQQVTEAGEKAPNEPLIIEEINHFLGWLLFFYLIAYFASHYILVKVLPGGNPLPGDFNLLSSGMLRYLLISIFLWYILLSLRIHYLRYKTWATALIIPLGIVLNASLVLNL